MATCEKDAAFRRKMFLLPVLMVILLICNSLLSYLITVLIERLLYRPSFGHFFGNWANFLANLEYLVLDILHALSYPLVLLFLYARLRKTWKSLFSCRKQYSEDKDNRQPHKSQSLPTESSSTATID